MNSGDRDGQGQGEGRGESRGYGLDHDRGSGDVEPGGAPGSGPLFDATDRALGLRPGDDSAGPRIQRWYVPGRIEVLGKHTDYAGGRSLLCAVERGFCVTAIARNDDRLRIVDVLAQSEAELRVSLAQSEMRHWRNYPATVARRIARNFSSRDRGTGLDRRDGPDRRDGHDRGEGATGAASGADGADGAGGVGDRPLSASRAADPHAREASPHDVRLPPLRGADVAIASDLPRSSGLSSSSALIIAIFSVLSEVNALAQRPAYRANIPDADALASYLGCVENGRTFGTLTGDSGVGTHGGSQDHLAILGSTPGHLVACRFSPVQRERLLPLPSGFTFVIGSSGVVASKTGRAQERYNRASAAVGAMLTTWRRATGRDDATLFDALISEPAAIERLRALLRRGGQDALIGRLEQFRLETFELIPGAIDALAAGDLAAFGTLVDRSQRAAVHLLGNQVPETVALQSLAREIGAAAASAFGAGFGGSVWALVPTAEAPAFLAAWRDRYLARYPVHAAKAEFFISAPGPGRVRIAARACR